MYSINKLKVTINHDYIYQSVRCGIITEEFGDKLISQLNKIYNQWYTENV